MVRFLTAVLSFVTISTSLFAQPTDCQKHQCIAVVDAGSSGSRLHVFSYDTDETNTPIHIKELWNKKAKPGFSSIELNAIDAYLSILMSDAPIKQIPVYFYATAGMRLLPQTKQKNHYNELKKWFSQHQEWQLEEAKTITGNEEGLYDWLSVNYHLGTFNASNIKPIGVLDMGGASVQIAFPIAESSSTDNRSQAKVTVYGKQYNLYIHSFLGLGQTEMSHQFLDSAACFANNYPLPDGAEGQGNAFSCEQELSSLMNNVHGVKQLIQPFLANNPVGSWYSIGGIANLADSTFFNFTNNKQFTNQELIQQADTVLCHQQWDVLNNQYPNDEYLYGYCLASAYYYALMVDGYGIAPEQAVHYMPPEKNIDWTTGVVLHH